MTIYEITKIFFMALIIIISGLASKYVGTFDIFEATYDAVN